MIPLRVWVALVLVLASRPLTATPRALATSAPRIGSASAPLFQIRYFEVGVGLTRESLEAALRAMEPQLTACAVRHAAGKLPLLGVALVTLPSGRVDSAGFMGWRHLDDRSHGRPGLNCQRDVLMAWRFPVAARFGLAAFHLAWSL